MYSLRIAFRNLRRNGVYSIINIVGLAVGLVACILIILWVQDELSFDRMHKKGKNIYRVLCQMEKDGQLWQVAPAPLGKYAKENIPEVKDYCRMSYYLPSGYLEYNSVKFHDVRLLAVDSSFFNVFDFRLIEGNLNQPFPDVHSAIVSKSKAKAIFGDENPIGKTLKASFGPTFHIAGIMEDMPENSSIRADMLLRFDLLNMFELEWEGKRMDEHWTKFNYITYLLLNDNADLDKINDVFMQKLQEQARLYGSTAQLTTRLQPLYSMHLYSLTGAPAGMKNVYIFSAIAFLILVIASINYINLVTARSSRRSKEVAIRKIMGAGKLKLFGQSMLEMVILVLVAMVLATAIIYLIIPLYNELSGKNLKFSLLSLATLKIYLYTVLATICLAGIYPALSLISFKATAAFKSGSSVKNKALFRRILVVVQFVFSIGLIMANIVLSSQLSYMRRVDLGYDKENVFMVWLNKAKYDLAKERLKNVPGVIGVTGSSYNNMGSVSFNTLKKITSSEPFVFQTIVVDTSYFSVMNIPFVEGGGYQQSMSLQSLGEGIIINEAGAKKIGDGNPVVGMKLDGYGGDHYEILAVTKDFNYQSLHEEIKPLVTFYKPGLMSYLYVKVLPNNAEKVIAEVKKIWEEYNPDYSFSYNFIDENFDRMYKSEIKSGQLFSAFAIIAVLISCLGLFGLITYTAESKIKEIGIRKTLGASVTNVVVMLSKEFLLLVAIAALIVFPVSYYLLQQLLQGFVYRVGISWWMFAVTAVVVLVLTVLTVSAQALRAARANPVKAIKTE